ncbi:MAG: chemotaxis protein CheB [Vulcanimicrobiota bacterium]
MSLWLVGVGSSAGGLQALGQFLSGLSRTGRAAYVVAQHQPLEADTGRFVDLLQSESTLPLQVVRSGQTLVADRVYWIPAGQDGRVEGQTLQLTPARGLSRPSVDLLLNSLAEHFGPRAAGVILSGAGRDGCEGCRAIGRAGGLALAQAPEVARFPGMPQAAISAGAANRVLPAEYMGELIADWLSSQQTIQGGLAGLLEQVKRVTGVDFRGYKEETLRRRLQRRLAGLKLSGLDDYLELVQRQPEELSRLQQDFLVSLSAFFRDEECFRALADELGRWLSTHRGPIRVWIPACASGEEAYSLAMLLVEILGAAPAAQRCWLSACDLNEKAVNFARRGIYSAKALEQLEPSRRDRYFTSTGKGYRVNELLRSMVRFSQQDVLTGPIPDRLDLISCRNLLIYLQSGLQNTLLQRFRDSLRPGGLLFLAPSETTGGLGGTLFTPVDKLHRLYRRRGGLSA